ncbi:flagellar FliL protein [Caldanaerobius fijiensis DSM 17918]|uniref:Flagellar protein FliL n=1 Tax=Caldanaerobius fijiensis DSM 17918 TaxID=1121256 RepID=A0A1M5C8I9_9THEO|nr:flagellar basal body-associated FliL family protein [Caldanaerobius fijiensis]SHF51063.1 flagellar FliL protein [Caldanaerobius fijiensis DSM 17918]
MKKSKPVYLTIIVLLLLVLAGEGYIFFAKGYAKASAATTVQSREYFYELPEDIITNLKDKGQYIKVSTVFSMKDNNLQKELEEKNGIIRNNIIAILANQSASDIVGQEGQDKLRELIEKSVNDILQTGKINNVYFKEFIVQY